MDVICLEVFLKLYRCNFAFIELIYYLIFIRSFYICTLSNPYGFTLTFLKVILVELVISLFIFIKEPTIKYLLPSESIIDQHFLIPAISTHIFNPTAELAILIGISTNEAKEEIET